MCLFNVCEEGSLKGQWGGGPSEIQRTFGTLTIVGTVTELSWRKAYISANTHISKRFQTIQDCHHSALRT